MGSVRAREIEAQLKNLNKLETSQGYEFKKLKERIRNIGTSDYTMRKAIIYRANYLNEIKKYSHLDNYDELMKKLNSITNPLKFFEYVSQNELIQDLTYQSDQYYTQEEFNRFVQDFNLLDIEDSVSNL